MNTHAKRAFSALATVAVLTVTVFGIVGLTAVPVLAAIWTDAELTGPTTGRVGETLTYTVRVLQCEGEHLGKAHTSASSVVATSLR